MATKSHTKGEKRRIEASIQRHLVKWLEEEFPHVRIVATLNENNRHCMDMGCQEGITDLLLFWEPNGDGIEHIFYLELKTKTGKLSDPQIEWAEKRPIRSNTHYAVAYGFSQAKDICCKIMLDTHHAIL